MAFITDTGDGRFMPYTNSGTTTIVAGTVIAFTNMIGVVMADILAGDTGSVQVFGRCVLPKATGTGKGLTQGTTIYYASGTAVITATASGNLAAGKVYKTAATTDATVEILLNL